MLDDTLKSQLQQYLGMLRQPITLIASLDDSATGAEMRELLQTIAGLSDKVTLDTTGSDARKPSFVIARAGETRGVRFAGLPLGQLERGRIEVEDAPAMPFELPGMGGNVGMINLSDMMNKAMGRNALKRRKLKVPEAWDKLVEEEAEKRMDQDDVARVALANAETNVIFRNDNIPVNWSANMSGGRAFDVLHVLIEQRERVVSKQELLDRVWPGLVVEEANLQMQIGNLRKVLGGEQLLVAERPEAEGGVDWAIVRPAIASVTVGRTYVRMRCASASLPLAVSASLLIERQLPARAQRAAAIYRAAPRASASGGPCARLPSAVPDPNRSAATSRCASAGRR